jgi:NADH:ubiquinone oxidoreductase subunit 6 (subunit J)
MNTMRFSSAEIATAIFALMTVGSACVAAFVQDMRKALLGLWAAGLSAGAMYLTVGQELLAIIQWVSASVATLTLLFSVALYGDPGAKRSMNRVRAIGPAFMSMGFVILTWFGAVAFRNDAPVVLNTGSSLATLGQTLLERHLVAVEIVALLFLAATIGAGVLTRKIRDPQESGQ